MTSTEISEVIKKNLQQIREQIAQACQRSGREQSSVQLVAVTKYAEWEWIEALAQMHSVFGENRPQQLAERHARLPLIQWHLIGQLQRNKVKSALEHAAVIHSVDSLNLLHRIESLATSAIHVPRLLLQVNVSGEASKSGFSPDELRNSWREIVKAAATLQICGLMTMAPECDNPEDARPSFRQLRLLRDELASLPSSEQAGLQLAELSMGMSGDFVPAVEEGATLIRIGTRIFNGLN